MKYLALLILSIASTAFGLELTNPITADGTYTVKTHPGQRYVFSAAGDFGSGSLAIKWNDGTSATAFSQSPATAAETWTFTAPTTQVDVVLSGATDPSITVGVTLASETGTVDNASVNSAISEDPASTQSALGITGESPLSPFFASELRSHHTLATIQTLTLLTFGDSMMSASRFPVGLERLAKNNLPIVGFALESLGTRTISGTVVTPPANSNGDASPSLWDTGKVWKLSTGAVIGIQDPVPSGFVGILASKVTVWCSKQSGGGTATIESSRDGGSTWAAVGTIDTSGTAAEIARGEFSLPNSICHYLLRITATSGPVNVIGAKMWDATRSGVILANANMGGITVSSTLAAPAAVRNQIGTDLGRTVIVYQFREGTGELTEEILDDWLDAWHTAVPNGEIILVDQLDAPQVAANDVVTPAVNALYAAASADRVYVKNYPLNTIVGNDAYRTERGWNTDTIHLANAAWEHVAADFLAKLTNSASEPISAALFTGPSGSREAIFAPVETSSAIDYAFRMPRAAKMRFGIISRNASGAVTRAAFRWTNPADTFSDGLMLEFQNDGGYRTPWVVDNAGYSVFGPYNATTQSGYTRGARVVVDEDVASRSAIIARHKAATPTAPVIKAENSAGTSKFEVWDTGRVVIKPTASETPAANGDLVIEATSNTSLTLKLKGSDGTVRSVVLTLSP